MFTRVNIPNQNSTSMTDDRCQGHVSHLPVERSRDRDRFSHGSDVPYDYVSHVGCARRIEIRQDSIVDPSKILTVLGLKINFKSAGLCGLCMCAVTPTVLQTGMSPPSRNSMASNMMDGLVCKAVPRHWPFPQLARKVQQMSSWCVLQNECGLKTFDHESWNTKILAGKIESQKFFETVCTGDKSSLSFWMFLVLPLGSERNGKRFFFFMLRHPSEVSCSKRFAFPQHTGDTKPCKQWCHSVTHEHAATTTLSGHQLCTQCCNWKSTGCTFCTHFTIHSHAMSTPFLLALACSCGSLLHKSVLKEQGDHQTINVSQKQQQIEIF